MKTAGYPAFSPAVTVTYQRGAVPSQLGSSALYVNASGGEFRPIKALLLWPGLDNDGRRLGYCVLMRGSDWLGPARQRPDFLREGK